MAKREMAKPRTKDEEAIDDCLIQLGLKGFELAKATIKAFNEVSKAAKADQYKRAIRLALKRLHALGQQADAMLNK